MLRSWLTLALVLAATGCFRNHGLDGDVDAASVDGGVDPSDGGMCQESEGQINALSCPASAAPGDVVRIGFTHMNSGCCSSGESRVSVERSGSTWTLEGEWTVCDCCEACRCVGPIEEDSIEIGPLDPGVHRVVGDGGSECTIVVEGEPSMCRAMMPTQVRTQRVLFDGQDHAFSLVQHETTCGCEPRLSRIPEDAFAADLCNCCDECFCADPPYAVSHLGPAGTLPTFVNDISLPTEQRPLDSCRPIVPTGLRIEPPESPVRRHGPAIWWAVVSGVETVCCVEPFGGVHELALGALGRHLELRSCIDFDCDCIGTPQTFEAWYPLGEYAPGSGDQIFAGGFEASFIAE